MNATSNIRTIRKLRLQRSILIGALLASIFVMITGCGEDKYDPTLCEAIKRSCLENGDPDCKTCDQL